LPDDKLLQREMKDVIEAAIAWLPPDYRSVILLRDVEELSTAEAAELLDVTPDVVKTRLHRARLALRHKLDEYLRTGAAPAAAN